MTTIQSRPTATRADGVAALLETALRPFVGGDLPVRLRGGDGCCTARSATDARSATTTTCRTSSTHSARPVHGVLLGILAVRGSGVLGAGRTARQARPRLPEDRPRARHSVPHVGEQHYGTYAQVLHDAVRPGGRVLIQQMSRAVGRIGHPGGGPLIESFIAQDMHAAGR